MEEKLTLKRGRQTNVAIGLYGIKKSYSRVVDKLIFLVPYDKNLDITLDMDMQETTQELPIDYVKSVITSFYGVLFTLWFVDAYVFLDYKGGLIGFIADVIETIDYCVRFM
jgi:hypothetical protein